MLLDVYGFTPSLQILQIVVRCILFIFHLWEIELIGQTLGSHTNFHCMTKLKV